MHITTKNLVQLYKFKKCIYLNTKCLPVYQYWGAAAADAANDKQQQRPTMVVINVMAETMKK